MALRQVTAGRNSNTLELWRGSSNFDGSPLVLLGSGFVRPSANRKTGDMLQVSVMARAVHPATAKRQGLDRGPCGPCPIRQWCFVPLVRGCGASWRTWEKGRAKAWNGAPFQHPVRLGAYGDPAALPAPLVRRIIEAAGRGWTAYTHHWRTAPHLKPWAMASVETRADAEEAAAAGWRSFRIRTPGSRAPLLPGEKECPFYTRGAQCRECQLCSGGAGRGRCHIVAPAHGPRLTLAVCDD
jgi:hypothetical protein